MRIFKKKSRVVEMLGYKFKFVVDKRLDQYNGKILFPKQHEATMKLINMLDKDNLDEILGRKKK